MNRSLLEGLSATGDHARQVVALNELNQILSLHQGELSVYPWVGALANLLTSGNTEILLLTCRAINNIIDIDPHSCGALVDGGVLPNLADKLLNLVDIDVAEQCLKR